MTDDKITCVYISPSEEMIREHARCTGLPADATMEIRTIIDPTTAEPSRKASMAGAVRSLAVLALAGAMALGSMACTADQGPLLEPTTSEAAVETFVAAPPAADDIATLRRIVAPYHRSRRLRRRTIPSTGFRSRWLSRRAHAGTEVARKGMRRYPRRRTRTRTC